MSKAMDGAVIHHLGYRRHDGPVSGRPRILGHLLVHSLRTAFGIGRGDKAKIVPWGLTGIVVCVAVTSLVLRVRTGAPTIGYLDLQTAITPLLLVLLATMAPALIGADLRHHLLDLYLARRIPVNDYLLAKLGGLGCALWLVLAAATLITEGGTLVAGGTGAPWRQLAHLAGGLVADLLYACVFAAVGVALSATTRRPALAGASIVAYVLASNVVGMVGGGLVGGDLGKTIGQLLTAPEMVNGLATWLFRVHGTNVDGYGGAFPVVTVVFVAGCLAFARWRVARTPFSAR
ncbi:MAG TPA: hypothetical protein VI011_21715 [Asanoa sp.]